MNLMRFIISGLIVYLVCFFISSAYAAGEDNLADQFSDKIYPYFAGEFDFGWFDGVGGKKIKYAAKTAGREKAALVFVTGRNEHITKYAELFYDLKELGFSFFIYDHRGQGSSERFLADPQKGHVVDFQYYIDDLSTFLDEVVFPQTDSPVFIISHSMGGTVSYQYARAHPKRLKGLVLCAPMFSINTAPIPKFIAELLVKSMVLIGASERYIFGGGPFELEKNFEGNDLTQSKQRFELNQNMVLGFPEVALGSPTFGWLSQSFSAMDSIQDTIIEAEDLPPVLMLSGTEDSVVNFVPQQKVCARLPDCRLQRIAGARHELMMEKDEIRNKVLRLIVEFVEERLGYID